MAAAPEHPSTALLEARNLTTFPQLFGVDFALARGTVAALDGPSREPKTWLLQVLAGLRRPDAGAVLFDGVRIDELGDHELREVRQRRFGFLFADGMLVPELTTAENCALPQMLAGADRDAAMDRAAGMLRDFGLERVRDRFPGQLSAAQAERLTVARAMAHRPNVIFADSPELTASTTAELLDAARAHGIAVVLATADPALLARAEQVLRLGERAPELAVAA